MVEQLAFRFDVAYSCVNCTSILPIALDTAIVKWYIGKENTDGLSCVCLGVIFGTEPDRT